MTPPTTIALRKLLATSKPAICILPAIRLVKKATLPTERSNSPMIISTEIPAATTTTTAVCLISKAALFEVMKNPSDATWK